MTTVRVHNKKNQGIPIELQDSSSKVVRSELLGAKKFMDVQSEELTKDCYLKASKRILKLEVRKDKAVRGVPVGRSLAMSSVK
jgi:hypothetical protein